MAIDEIELKARECIIEEFKSTLKLTKQQLCGAGDEIIASSTQSDITANTNQEKYMDCAFSPSEDSQKIEELNNEKGNGKEDK